MKEYCVEVPAVMNIRIVVLANSEEEAVEKAMACPVDTTMEFYSKEHQKYSDYNLDDYIDVEHEWEQHKQVVRGNVYYGSISKVNVVEENEIEEE